MTQTMKKIAIASLAACLLVAAAPASALVASAATDNDAQIVGQMTPLRDSEYGNTVGDLIYLADGKTVVQNYELGYVTAELISETRIQNKRDVGGMRMSENGEATFLDMESWIKGRGTELDVEKTWNTLANKYESTVTYAPSYALEKIYEEYASLCEQGYNCGIPTDNLSVWDGAVIKLDFYDGDSEYGFDGNRIHVTTIAYSFYKDRAYMIAGEIFNFYKEAKAGSLGEPVSDPFDYTLDGKQGKAQAFVQGYIFQPESGDLVVRTGVRYNEENGKFDDYIVLEFDELTQTEITQVAIDSNPYYGGRGFTVQSVKELFYNKYLELIDSGYNPGIPDAEGIFYWDSEVLKQAYVGSDGTGDAWGRTNMMLILNPEDGHVYMINGEILNIVDESSQGLGNAVSLGYPLGDEKSAQINGFTYYYQEFSQGTIYSIEHSPQLTRFIKGKTFAEVTAANASYKPNNPDFFYVVEPWAIALICVGGAIVLAGGAVGLYFGVFRKKKHAQQGEAQGEEE